MALNYLNLLNKLYQLTKVVHVNSSSISHVKWATRKPLLAVCFNYFNDYFLRAIKITLRDSHFKISLRCSELNTAQLAGAHSLG